MLLLHESRDRRYRSQLFVHPVKNAEKAWTVYDAVAPTGAIVWCKDGRRHGRIPALVLPNWVDSMPGCSSENLRLNGYTLHWQIFRDMDKGEYSFGNRPSFSRSKKAEDRERARYMPVISDIDTFLEENELAITIDGDEYVITDELL